MMIHLINCENRDAYTGLLDQMYKQRKNIFIDRLGWNLSIDDGREIDEFDTEDTMYLVAMDNNDEYIRSSLRLNPTTKPHLMSELFSDYCEHGVPVGENIFEISRYCYNPNVLDPQDRFGAMKQMMCGVMECAVLHGWEKLTFVINMPLLAHCIRCGWEINPLGLPKEDNGRPIGAFAISVNLQGLHAVRRNAGNALPTLRILPPRYAAA